MGWERRRRRPRRSSSRVPFSSRAKKVLELALRESLALHHRHIGPEHILLALLREGRGLAASVLVAQVADLPEVRRRVLLAIGEAA